MLTEKEVIAEGACLAEAIVAFGTKAEIKVCEWYLPTPKLYVDQIYVLYEGVIKATASTYENLYALLKPLAAV